MSIGILIGLFLAIVADYIFVTTLNPGLFASIVFGFVVGLVFTYIGGVVEDTLLD